MTEQVNQEQTVQEKSRFNLKLDAELLAELEVEANAKGLSTTSLIVDALKRRNNTSDISSDEHFIKGLGLCPECAERYRAYANARPIMRKFFRDQIWNLWGVWEHGKEQEGCPGWDKIANPEEVKKYRDRLAEEWLAASV